ncbi:C-signal-like [Lepisosteus oculatus]|uniref:C-signal-like n=1 Tax=Lepisosteus oculatus TaxID=7918 RepID=UPI0035F5281D
MGAEFQSCRTVLITGAGRGLGLQMVKQLVTGNHRPLKIIATAREPAAAKELKELSEKYKGLHVVPLDVVSQGSIEKALQEVGSLVGDEGLNCLINNAGIMISGDIETVTAEGMMKNFETNTVSPLMITKAFLPLLRKAAAKSTGMGIHRAAIINISSMLGSIELHCQPVAGLKCCPYRTSKAALNMVTRCLAVDLEADGILCTAIHPGWVRTDMGGAEAPLSKEDSISSVLKVIASLSEKENGGFLSYDGKPLPW